MDYLKQNNSKTWDQKYNFTCQMILIKLSLGWIDTIWNLIECKHQQVVPIQNEE